MFIATCAHPKDLAPLGAKPGSGTIAEAGKRDCAPTELKSKEKDRQAINVSPLWGERQRSTLASVFHKHLLQACSNPTGTESQKRRQFWVSPG